MHPVQEAFRDNHGLQCGYCTPGMVMAVVSLLAENPDPTEAEVRLGLEGNLCRCTGYHNIVRAVLAAAKTGRGGGHRNDSQPPSSIAGPRPSTTLSTCWPSMERTPSCWPVGTPCSRS